MYNRICILGGSGSGKSTLARILSNELRLPCIHIDSINYDSNWTQVDKSKRDTIILEKLSQDKWIIDGNYLKTLPQRLEKADFVIFLDYSSFSLITGVLKRITKNYGKEKFDIPGCREHLDFKFLRYVTKFNKTKRYEILNLLNTIPNEKIITFKNRKSLNKWLVEFTGNKDVLKSIN